MELDNICEFILNNIANRQDSDHYGLYPYFTMENGELISDNGINPKRVVSEFEKYGLSKPLDNERCELTELGVKIGQGIGFKKHKANEEKNKSDKETIEKRKNANTNHTYWFVRPRNIIGTFVIILFFVFGITNKEDLKNLFRREQTKEHNQDQEPKLKNKESENIEDSIKTKKTQEYNKDTIYSKSDSTELKTDEKN